MRKVRISVQKIIKMAVLLAALLSLAACSNSASGESPEDFALRIREELTNAERLVVGADITADYGDRVYIFSVKYTGSAEVGEIKVLSPEEVAGIVAEVTLESCVLVYDGVRLDTGALTDGGLSPAGALPALICEWQNGRVLSIDREKLDGADTLAISTEIGGLVSQKTWFDVITHLPVRAEISDGGRMVVACVFNNVVIEDKL